MTDERKDLPPVGSPNFLERVRETLSVYLGRRGDALDRGVVLRDLYDAGVVDVSARYLSSGRGVPVAGGGTSVEPAYVEDLTPPPTPTGFVASAAISNILVQCDSPIYFVGNGHQKARLYGATWVSGALPVFSGATLLTEFPGSVTAYPTNPSTTWRLWLTWVTADGVESVIPAGGINGITVTTGLDLDTMMVALKNNPEYAGDLMQRSREIRDLAESELRALVGINQARLDAASTVAFARTELTSDFVAGISAEAASRTTLAAKVDTNQTSALALISAESLARSTAISAEAASRTTLAAQFRGTYEGSDINAVTTGLFYQERLVRAAQDLALSNQITSLSAGAGEQFDYSEIWYFDDTVESWTGNGTPTWTTGGFLRPADAGSSAYVVSPSGLAVEAATYNQVKLRYHKTGLPTFAGFLWWRAIGDATWDVSRRVAFTEPTYDAYGMGVITATATWTGTIDLIRIDLSDAQSVGTCYEIDWIAIGRPSPGASYAQIIEEQEARADGDTAVAATVTTLSSQVNDAVTGLPAAHAALTVEAETRADQTGDIFAKYSVKVDTNGYVSGFDLISTGNVTTTPLSDFRIRADKFSIGSPSGPGLTPIDNVFVAYTSDTTINGVAVPAGIYMDAAYIANGTIIGAKIGTATIDSAKIISLTATKITAGSINVGEYIQSSSYVAGSGPTAGVGWRIHGDGNLEVSNALVRGTVYATNGSFSGTVTIKDTGGNTVFTSGSSVAASNWLGNVSGTVGGTSASTLVTNLADIASDSKLTPVEKQSLRIQWAAIYDEKAGINASAAAQGITTENTTYNTNFQALGTYLNGGTTYSIGATPPLWITDAQLGVTTDIVGANFRANWTAVYNARQALLNKVVDAIKVGGRNLLLNSATMSTFESQGGNGVVTAGEWVSVGTGAEHYRVFTYASAVVGRQYTFSYYARSTGLSRGIILPVNQNNVWSGYEVLLVNSADYIQVSKTITCTTAGNIKFAIDNYLNTAGGTLYAKWPKIEEGNKATAWSEAPEDVSGRITTAQTQADAANALLSDIASDSKFTPVEKQSAKLEWLALYTERSSINDSADIQGIVTEKDAYNLAFQNLGNYLNNGAAYTIGTTHPAWINGADLVNTTDIVGSTFRTTWSNAYTARQALLNKIAEVASTKATWATVSGTGRPEDNATLGADSSNLKAGAGSNMLFNGSYRDGLAGTFVGFQSGGIQHTLGLNLSSNYQLVGGEALAYTRQLGTVASGSVFDVYPCTTATSQSFFNVQPNKRYEAHAWMNAHSCAGYVVLIWYDAAQVYLGTEVPGNQVTFASNVTKMSDLRQSVVFATAPANAAYGLLVVRAMTQGTADPYLFFTRVFLGEAGAAQTTPSPWSAGGGISFIDSNNITTYIAGAAIGNAQIGNVIQSASYSPGVSGWKIDKTGAAELNNATFRGTLDVKSAASGARVEIKSNVIKVFDASGILRVRIGDLAA